MIDKSISKDELMTTHDLKQAVQHQFGQVASNYTTSPVHAQGADLAIMRQTADLTPAMRVLDAGCGAGHTAFIFAPAVREVVAYDLTAPMLAQVQQNAAARGLTNIVTELGDVANLPFADATFDVVVSRYSAHHWGKPLAALQEFVRVLKPNGQFILSDIVAPDEDFMADTFLQTLELLRDPSHVRDHTATAWLTMCADAGFAKANVVQRFEVPLHFGQWLQRIGTSAVHAAALRSLFEGAPHEIKQRYHLPDTLSNDDFEFRLYGAVLQARR